MGSPRAGELRLVWVDAEEEVVWSYDVAAAKLSKLELPYPEALRGMDWDNSSTLALSADGEECVMYGRGLYVLHRGCFSEVK